MFGYERLGQRVLKASNLQKMTTRLAVRFVRNARFYAFVTVKRSGQKLSSHGKSVTHCMRIEIVRVARSSSSLSSYFEVFFVRGFST